MKELWILRLFIYSFYTSCEIFVAELIINSLSFKKPQIRKLVTLISLMSVENLSRFLHGLKKRTTSSSLTHYVFRSNALRLSYHS